MLYGDNKNQMQKVIDNGRERVKIQKDIKRNIQDAREAMKQYNSQNAFYFLKSAKYGMLRLQMVGLTYRDKEYKLLSDEIDKTFKQMEAIDKYGKKIDDYEVVKQTMEHYKKWDW